MYRREVINYCMFKILIYKLSTIKCQCHLLLFLQFLKLFKKKSKSQLNIILKYLIEKKKKKKKAKYQGLLFFFFFFFFSFFFPPIFIINIC